MLHCPTSTGLALPIGREGFLASARSDDPRGSTKDHTHNEHQRAPVRAGPFSIVAINLVGCSRCSTSKNTIYTVLLPSSSLVASINLYYTTLPTFILRCLPSTPRIQVQFDCEFFWSTGGQNAYCIHIPSSMQWQCSNILTNMPVVPVFRAFKVSSHGALPGFSIFAPLFFPAPVAPCHSHRSQSLHTYLPRYRYFTHLPAMYDSSPPGVIADQPGLGTTS